MNITGWGETVDAVLGAANVKQVELARLLKIRPPVLNRYLRGERQPDSKTVAKINRAIAKLTGHAHIAPYLDTEAAFCGLVDAAQRVVDDSPREPGEIVIHADYSHRVDTLARMALGLLDTRYGPIYMTGYRESLQAYMRGRGEAEARRFVVALNRAFLKVLTAELQPHTAPIGFGLILDVLRQHGIDAKLTEFGAFTVAWEHVQWAVRQELARANPFEPSKERLAAERRIFDALNKRFNLHLKTQGTEQRANGDRA